MRKFPSLETIQSVIITGGSSGIGATYIRTMRNLGHVTFIGNLSRSEPDRFSQDSRCQHYPCDLSDADALKTMARDLIRDLEARTAGPILLINNSGFGSYGRFDQLSREVECNMVDLNVRAVVDLTARLLPLLLARGGWILNVASVAGWQPTPFMATYGASKAFVLHWSLALREDLFGRGVGVLTVCPGPTESQFFRRAGFSDSVLPGQGQTAQEVVDASLAALKQQRSFVVTGWRNRLLVMASARLPRAWQGPIARVLLQRFRLDRLKKPSENPGNG